MTSLVSTYYRLRSKWWRLQRILFSSPAELRFIEIMGGKSYTLGFFRSRKTGFPLAIVTNMGQVLKDERFKREVRIGRFYVDLGNDIKWCFEIDGRQWHRDIVADFDREVYIRERGWRIKRIDAVRLWNEPDAVQRDVLAFLYAK